MDVDQNEDRDTLTYELDNDNDPNNPVATVGDLTYFSIDKATGQISVAKKLDWDNNPALPDEPRRRVRVLGKGNGPVRRG